jgi:TolB-like protein/Flp pilus assembly protein TadD
VATATVVAPAPPVVPHPAPSIAVLPFADLSQQKDQAYMSDGLAEELLSLLAQVPGLRVIARTSSFSFADKSVDVATIGRALDVEHVLQGSVRREGNKLRITSQLVRAADNTQLWSKTYDRTVGDVFAVQEEIAAAVVSELKVTLMSGPPQTQKTSPEAFSLFLRARQSGRSGTLAGRRQAIALYKQVLALDPAYAPAWVGLSTNYGNLANDGAMPLEQGFALARQAADKALAIDPNYARAHAQRAYVAFNFDNDLPLAARRIESALSLDPHDLGSILNAAGLALSLGRLEQATALDRYVVSRDPLNATAHYNLGVALLFGGHDAEAITSWRQALALSPDFAGAWFSIGAAQLSLGQPEAALASIRKEPSEILRAIGLPMAYPALGQTAKADAALAELERVHGGDAAFNIAYVHALRGESDEAFEWLERAVQNKDTGLPDIIYEPNLASLHADPRWLPLLRRLGRAPEQLAAVPFDARPPL